MTGVDLWATAHPNTRKVARGVHGDLWCVFMEEIASPTAKHMYLGHSTDNGATWEIEEIVTEGEVNEEHPCIAVDAYNNVHIVWNAFPGICYLRKTQDGWDEQVYVDTEEAEGTANMYPALAVSSAGDVHIVWRGDNRGTNWAVPQIVYRAKISGTWQDEELVTDVAGQQLLPAICLDSNEDVHICWTGAAWNTNTGYFNIQYRKRTSGGWQTQEALSDVAGDQWTPSIAIDSDDNPHISWTGSPWGTNVTKANVQYRMRTTEWQAQEGVTDVAHDQYNAAIAIDGSDDVHVAWVGLGWGTNTTKRNLQYNKRTTGWGSQVALTDLAYDQRLPCLVFAVHPITGDGAQTNRPAAGYAFIWTAGHVGGYQVTYYGSSDLAWDYVPRAVKYASGQPKEVFT